MAKKLRIFPQSMHPTTPDVRLGVEDIEGEGGHEQEGAEHEGHPRTALNPSHSGNRISSTQTEYLTSHCDNLVLRETQQQEQAVEHQGYEDPSFEM
jgi:hypothetical protein